jgi:DNA-binding beta-propeller fold protein YncE
LDIKTGNFQKILGPVQGLTTLVSPDGKTVMLSQSNRSKITTGFYTVATGAYRNSDLVTMPEKCFWSSNTVVTCGIPQTISSGVYPDDWYQGTKSFSDNLWSIDTSSGATTDILNPTQLFDMIHVRTSPDGNYAYFINKTDETLWSYRLK